MTPKTLLFLSANPKDTTRLRLDKEVREIDEGLKRSREREQFILQQRWATRPIDFYRAMLDYEPQIVHFSGHGAGVQGICFEDDSGQICLVSTGALSELFALFRNVECVVLNACYSETQANEIARHTNYVIGMSDELKDELAITFSVAFYDALGAGKSVEFAFNLACAALRLADASGKFIPVLKARQNSTQQIKPSNNVPGLQVAKDNEAITFDSDVLKVQFPYAVTCEVSRQVRKAQIGRIELKNTGEKVIPSGWRAKITLLRPIDFRITLIDTIIMPSILPNILVPIGPFVVDVPRDIVKSEDKWHLELYIVNPQGNEYLIFRSPSVQFV